MRSEFNETRRHILETGRTIIVGKGFAAVGLNEILTTAGVPKGSFYHYFKSKEQFGNALLTEYFDTYLAHLEQILGADGSPASVRLIRYFQHWQQTQSCDDAQSRCLVVKLSAEVADLSETMRQTLQQGTCRIIERLAAAVAEGRADGSLPPSTQPRALAQELYQLWLGAALLSRLSRDGGALKLALATTRRQLGLPPAA